MQRVDVDHPPTTDRHAETGTHPDRCRRHIGPDRRPALHHVVRRRRARDPADGGRGARQPQDPARRRRALRRAPHCERSRTCASSTAARSPSRCAIGDGTVQIEINGIQKHLLDRARARSGGARQPDHRRRPRAGRDRPDDDAVERCRAAHQGRPSRRRRRRAPADQAHARSNGRSGWCVLDRARSRSSTACTPPARSMSSAVLDGVEVESLSENEFAVLRAGSQSALTRRVGDELVLLPHAVPEPWGLRPRNKEQRFALELLLDPDIAVVALDGRAGTGKTILAIAAALEQVVEQPRYERVAVYRPLVPGRAGRRRLPAGRPRREARPVDVGDPRRDRRPHRPRQQPRRPAPDRRADRTRAALARVGDVPPGTFAAAPDRRDRRGPEPRADDAAHDPHPCR